MKKIFFIAAIFSFFGISQAQQPDAVYKLLHYEWTLNADGSSDYHYRHEVQILRNRSLVAYADKGETFVVYNPDLETVTVNEVYTRRPDGSRVEMPQNAFIYQLPSECADCGRFNHMRELAMVHTGMEIGCVIVVDYTVHRQYNMLYESIPLRRECPVEKLEVVVNNNAVAVAVNYDTLGRQYLSGAGASRKVTYGQMDGRRTTSTVHTFSNLPQAPKEPYMPADIVPVLRIFNGTPNHEPAFDQAPFAGAEDAMGKVMKGDMRENIIAMRNFILDNIHLNDIHPSHLGYVHSTPAEVWATGCGTATDKAVLLAAILNHEGYRARVVGDEMDAVGVMVDTLEYRLDVRRRAPMELIGEAKDEVSKLDANSEVEAKLDTLEDGFFSLTLGGIPEAQQPSATALPVGRTTPLVTTACDVKSTLTYLLPKGVKMLGAAVNRTMEFPGVGNLEISIKQSGKKLKVVRNLKIDKSTVAVADYASYRQLVAAWQSVDKVMLRAK